MKIAGLIIALTLLPIASQADNSPKTGNNLEAQEYLLIASRVGEEFATYGNGGSGVQNEAFSLRLSELEKSLNTEKPLIQFEDKDVENCSQLEPLACNQDNQIKIALRGWNKATTNDKLRCVLATTFTYFKFYLSPELLTSFVYGVGQRIYPRIPTCDLTVTTQAPNQSPKIQSKKIEVLENASLTDISMMTGVKDLHLGIKFKYLDHSCDDVNDDDDGCFRVTAILTTYPETRKMSQSSYEENPQAPADIEFALSSQKNKVKINLSNCR